jgi:Uma2 family endonuclease
MTAMIPTTHGGPWSEEEYLALGETEARIELFDGALHVSPSPPRRHHRILRRLANLLDPGAEARGLIVDIEPNVRLMTGRLVIPDLIVSTELSDDELVASAAAIELVCEITSSSNAATDKVLKMHYYAGAGIPWYLIVEHQTLALQLFRLQDGVYTKHSTTEPGGVLRMSEPVTAEIRPESLLPER